MVITDANCSPPSDPAPISTNLVLSAFGFDSNGPNENFVAIRFPNWILILSLTTGFCRIAVCLEFAPYPSSFGRTLSSIAYLGSLFLCRTFVSCCVRY